MNTNPTIAELAAEVKYLVDFTGTTEFRLQELIDEDLACRFDDTQSTVDDLEYRLTEVESLVEGLEGTNPTLGELAAEVTDLVVSDWRSLFDKTKELQEKLAEQNVLIEALEHRLARLEGQSFLARLFRKEVK